MSSKYTIHREYQLGGHSTFGVSTLAGLTRAINRDAKEMRESGDCQGLGYTLSEDAAKGLGLIELRDGGWLIPDTEIVLHVDLI